MSLLQSMLHNCQQNLLRGNSIFNVVPKAFESIWRYPDYGTHMATWPNYKPHLSHHKHKRRTVKPFSEGIFKQTRVRVVDNSKIGMEAMSIGRAPKVVQVYSPRHRSRPHGAYGALGMYV